MSEKNNSDKKTKALEDLQYRQLFDQMGQGFHVIELLYNEYGQVSDYLSLEANKAFECQTGLSNTTGKLGSEIAPNIEAYWFEAYDRVVKTGEAARFENYNAFTNRWYDVFASRIGNSENRQVAIVFSDITERKKAELTLQEAEERHIFLLKLSDVLRPLGNSVTIQEAATRIALDYFKCDRCYYNEIINGEAIIRRDAAQPGLDSVAGVYPLDSLPVLRQVIDTGRAFIVEDVQQTDLVDESLRELCIKLQVISFINIPVIKEGRPVGVLCVVEGKPRQWTSFETTIAIEVAERIWAAVERAGAEEALRISEQRFRSFVAASSNMIYRMSADWREMFMLSGKEYLADTAEPLHNWVDVYIPEKERDDVWAEINNSIALKQNFTLEHQVFLADGTTGWVHSWAIPVLNEQGNIKEWIGAGSDITFRKQGEMRLKEFNSRLEEEVRVHTAELKQSKDLLQATLDSSPNMIQVFKAVRDNKGQIIDFIWILNNHTSEHLYGDVLNKRLLQINPGVISTGIFKHFVEVTESGISRQYEQHYIYEQFDGWFHQSVVKLNDGVATSTLDFTTSKKAEIELKESRDLMQSAFDTSLIQMAVLHAIRDENNQIEDFEIKIVNKELERETGRKDLVGKRYAQEYPGIKTVGLYEIMLRVMETGISEGCEYYYPHEGFYKWFSCMFVRSDDGLIATNLDITQRKRAEEERLKNYTLLQQSEDIARLGSWAYDLTSGAFSWSDGMYRLFNLEKGTEVKPEIYLAYTTEAARPAAERLVQHIRHGDLDFEETIELMVDDHIKIVHLKAAVIRNDLGHPVRVLGVDMDMTAMRAAEERIRKMEAEQQIEVFRVSLSTLEEERYRIAESLHNGIGQLLYGIKISLSGLKQDMSSPAEFNETKSYTNELLTDAIKETRRVSHELMPITLEDFGLQSAIDDVCQQLQDGVKFSCKVTGLKGRLEKYLELAVYRTTQELMMNVVKHARATAASVELKVQPEKIIITVTDNGLGIEAAKKNKPGIGLTSIFSKVKLLNGNVAIRSAHGSGTIVEVMIPNQNLK